MKRDNRGRYTKIDNEGYNINFYVPSFKTLIFWILLIIILFPWIVIGPKLEFTEKDLWIF